MTGRRITDFFFTAVFFVDVVFTIPQVYRIYTLMATRLWYTVATMLQPPQIRVIIPNTSEDELRDIVAKALCGQQASMQKPYYDLISTTEAPPNTPLVIHADHSIIWTAWHHGTDFLLCAIGGAVLLDHCALTDTEHERLSLAARRAEAHGNTAIVVAQGILVQRPKHLAGRPLECVGLVFLPLPRLAT